MATFQVGIDRQIYTSVEVEAESPEAALERVQRVDFTLPQHNDWDTVKDDVYTVMDEDGEEIEE